MVRATATEVQDNFEKFLEIVETGEEVVILSNNIEIARLLPFNRNIHTVTDSLVGALKGDYNEKDARAENMNKYK